MSTISTQNKINIREIRDNLVILKNGNLRAILMVSSTNFGLKSTNEQDAIIVKFEEFLNSLDFPIQILTSSRQLNITPYLNILDEKAKDQKNELLRIQTEEYKEFIKELVKISNIMTKTFYVVIPLDIINAEEGFFSSFLNFLKKEEDRMLKNDFERSSNQIWQRVEFISNALFHVGLKSILLKTEDLIELFYCFFNPGSINSQGLSKATIEELAAASVLDNESEEEKHEKNLRSIKT